jgi:hypothetical protein
MKFKALEVSWANIRERRVSFQVGMDKLGDGTASFPTNERSNIMVPIYRFETCTFKSGCRNFINPCIYQVFVTKNEISIHP